MSVDLTKAGSAEAQARQSTKRAEIASWLADWQRERDPIFRQVLTNAGMTIMMHDTGWTAISPCAPWFSNAQ